MDKKERYGLIIQPGALGDGILMLPMVRLMLQGYGMTRIDVLGHLDYLQMLLGRSDIGRLYSLDQTPLHSLFCDSADFDPPENDPLIRFFQPYELVVTFLADERGHFERNLIFLIYLSHAAEVATLQLRPPDDYPHHVSHFFMEQLVQAIPEWQVTINEHLTQGVFIHPLPSDKSLGQKILQQTGARLPHQTVLLHPGSGGLHKCWPLDNFRQLAVLLAQKNLHPVILLGPAEQQRWQPQILAQLKREMPVLTDLTLDEVLALLSGCAAYVGNDSGISHLAGAMGVKTATVFGPTNPRHWQPLGPESLLCHTTSADWPEPPDVLQQLEQLRGLRTED